METKTSILIVGGGPSGSLCGIKLQQAGKDCLIVDRATFPRMKLCAGVLTGKSRRLLESTLGRSMYEELLRTSQRSHESHLRLWHGKRYFADCDFSDERQIPPKYRHDDWRFVLVDRPTFDDWLLRYYQSINGKAILGNGIKSIDFDSRVATLRSGDTVRYDYLVACDGAYSHTERLLKKHDPEFEGKGPNALAYEINVDRTDLDIDGINVCFGYAPQTYAWAFAKGDSICLGTCRLNGTSFDGQETMKRFCNDLGLKHQEKYPLKGAMIPFDNAMKNPVWKGSVLFCGDAAGLDEAVTGEGIFYALQSGADAAVSLIKGNVKLYVQSNAYLQALMHKAAKYQKLLSSPTGYKVFRSFASHHNRFLGYFYLTQIDHSSLDRVWKIFRNYLRELKFCSKKAADSETKSIGYTKPFIDFLRYSLHDDREVPDSAAKIDWQELLKFGEDQSILGVLFHGIKRLTPSDPHPSARELAQWGVNNTSIVDQNREVYTDAYHATLLMYQRYGHKSCLLKGQGNALMYPDPYMRMPGDIDLWVIPNEGETTADIIRLCRKIDPKCELSYHHADITLPFKTTVELHYRPSFTENLFYNHRLQKYFDSVSQQQVKNIVELPDELGQISVPTDDFNRLFQLSHIMKHFLFEGIGLRHIIDYYYLLRRGTTDEEKREFKREARRLGMWKFARGLMYVLNHYLGLEEQYLIAPQNKRIGLFIMREVLATGNFGFSDKRFESMKSDNSTISALYSVLKGLRFIVEFPAEALFGHSTWILWWHFYYRKKMERQIK